MNDKVNNVLTIITIVCCIGLVIAYIAEEKYTIAAMWGVASVAKIITLILDMKQKKQSERK